MTQTKHSIAFTVIGGFLGSGKTSLLNHMLRHANGRKLYAMVNDFGALNIDAELIAAQNGSQMALTNGCVCCSIGDDFTRALFAVLQQDAADWPEHIIVEASGVADPARIAAFAAVDKQLRLNGIVTLVDTLAHETHAHDPYLSDNYDRQIDAAHLLLLSKTDLARRGDIDALHAELATRRPDTARLEISHGEAPLDLVLGLEHADHPASTLSTLPSPLPMPLENHGLKSWATHIDDAHNRSDLVAKLETLSPHLLRAKGVLKDKDGAYILHFAAGRTSIEPHIGDSSGHFVLIGTPALPDDAALAALF